MEKMTRNRAELIIRNLEITEAIIKATKIVVGVKTNPKFNTQVKITDKSVKKTIECYYDFVITQYLIHNP